MKTRTKVIIGGLLTLVECAVDHCVEFVNGGEVHEQLNYPVVAEAVYHCVDGEICPI